MNSIPKQEILRKVLHILASIIPISLIWFPFDTYFFSFFLFIIIGIGIFLEYGRWHIRWLKMFFYYLNFMMRNKELNGGFTGATWLLIGCFFSVIFFPKDISIVSMLFLTIGDTFAAIIGIAFPLGKYKGKTISGSIGGFSLAGIVILCFIDNFDPTILIVGVIFSMLIEMLPLPINDNLTIPIFSGFGMVLTSYIL